MATQDRQTLMAEMYDRTMKNLEEGEVVKGVIVGITQKEVIIDIGFKSEGFVPIEEFHDRAELNIGRDMDVLIESIEDENGRLILSRSKAERLKGWQKIATTVNEGDLVEGRVLKQVKGGYIVDVQGVEAFLPLSLSAFKGVAVSEVMSAKYKFQIAKMNKQRRSLILSRRDVVQKEKEMAKAKLWDLLEKGQRRSGTVKGITDFGAFIDLGGIDGLLHITDMSWSRISHPSEIVAVGDKMEVLILDFDRENSKVSLGLKQIMPNPWTEVAEKYPIGSRVKGKVVNIMPYGVFVEIEKGIEGLLHASEISWQKKIMNPQEVYAIGDIAEVQIISIDKDTKRISLSVRQLESNPWLEVENKFPIGSRIEGKVRGFTDYGAFIDIGSNLEGMIHISDMSWTRRISHPQEVLKKGQDVEVMVVSVDGDNRKISLGLKQLTPNPWQEIAKKYPVGTVSEAEVVNLSNFGIFVKLDEELEALLYSSEIDKQAAASLKPGDKVQVKVIKVDMEQMKIGVSSKVS